MENVMDVIVSTLEAHFAIDPVEVSATSRLIEDLGMDSLDMVEMVLVLEEELSISVADGDSDDWITVGDVVDYLENL